MNAVLWGGVLIIAAVAALGWQAQQWRRQAVAARALLQSFVSSAGFGLCVRDAAGQMCEVNARLKSMLGIPPGNSGADWLNALPAGEGEVLRKTWQQAPEAAGMREVVLRPEGAAPRWLCISFVPLAHRSLSISVEDITERRLADETSRESEQRFAEIFYLLPAVATITNVATGRFVDVNHMWEPLFGFSREETIGHTSTELRAWVDPEDRKIVVSAVLRDGVVRDYPFRARRKDQRIMDCMASGRLIELHGERYLLLIVRDVTAELRVARALQESEAKFSSIFRESLAPLVLSRADSGMALDANQAWLDLMHQTREELIGHCSLDLGLWASPEERERIVEQVSREGFANRIECHMRGGDEVIRLCLASCRHIELNGEKCLIWSLQDITEQRAMELEIQSMNATLEQRVKARTAELEKANHDLQTVLDTLQRAQDELVRAEKLAALGGLVAGVAHELNTPIGNSVTAASALQFRTEEFRQAMEGGALKRSTLEDYLDYAATGSQLLMRSLEQARELVASFKQVAVDRTSDLRRKFDLAEFVSELLRTYHSAMRRSTCKISVEVAVEAGIRLDSFPGSLGQVLSNFISNAMLHAFEGRSQGRLRIAARQTEAESVVLRFEDDGVGITPENLKRIFDPFYTTKFGQGGSGLGLHIAYSIVTNVLGGQISVESEPGQGTRFLLRLPLSAPEGVVENPMQLRSPPAVLTKTLH